MSNKIISPKRSKHKSVIYCCVSGCTINSKTHPNTVFHILNNENITLYNLSKYNFRGKLQICNDHYFSNELLDLNIEQFSSESSPSLQENVSNYFIDSTPKIEAVVLDMPSLDDEKEVLTTNEQNVCRICFSQGNFKNINKDWINGSPIIEMLDKFCFLNIPKFPEYICNNCLNKLCISYEFIQQLDNSTQHLLNINQNYKLENKITNFESTKVVDENKISTVCKNVQNIEKHKRLIILLKKLTVKDIKEAKTKLQSAKVKTISKNHKTPKQKQSKIIDKNCINLNSPDDLKLQLEKVLKRENPFLAKVEINDVIKIRKNPYLQRKQKGRPIKPENKQKNRVLSLMSGEIKHIFEAARDINEISQDELIATPPFGESQLGLQIMASACDSCNKIFLKSELLDLHECDGEDKVELVLEKKSNTCQICHQTFSNIHFFLKHRCMIYICDICSLQFNSMDALHAHKELIHSILKFKSKFKCGFCGRFYQHSSTLKQHLKSKHSV